MERYRSELYREEKTLPGEERERLARRMLRPFGRGGFTSSLATHNFFYRAFVAYNAPGLPTGSLGDLVGKLVTYSLRLVGTLALGFFVYGGFKYLTARGDEQLLESAKSTMTTAIISIIIIGLAYAIIAFTFSALQGGGAVGT